MCHASHFPCTCIFKKQTKCQPRSDLSEHVNGVDSQAKMVFIAGDLALQLVIIFNKSNMENRSIH